MEQETRIILDLSDEVQTFLEQQHMNLYEELQQAIPSLRFRVEADPDAPSGSRGDLATVILASASLVNALSPLIIRLLNQHAPSNQSNHWEVEETETRPPDGAVIIQRKRVRRRDEERPWITPPPPLDNTNQNQQ